MNITVKNTVLTILGMLVLAIIAFVMYKGIEFEIQHPEFSTYIAPIM